LNLASNILELNLVKNVSDSPKASFEINFNLTCSTNFGSLNENTLFLYSKKDNEIKKLNNLQEKIKKLHIFNSYDCEIKNNSIELSSGNDDDDDNYNENGYELNEKSISNSDSDSDTIELIYENNNNKDNYDFIIDKEKDKKFVSETKTKNNLISISNILKDSEKLKKYFLSNLIKFDFEKFRNINTNINK
jgi:hypothetical protein